MWHSSGLTKARADTLYAAISTGEAVIASGLNTTALTSSGLFGYISANDILSLTDNLNLATAKVFGCSNSTSGQAIVLGIVTDAKFTTVGGMPGAGNPIWLAASTDEASASGKLTATVPTSGIIVEVGLCLNNTNYASLKTSKILFLPKQPIVL